MMVTNIISNPTDTITLHADKWAPITKVPKKPGTTYFVSVYLHVSSGSITVHGSLKHISSDQRVSYRLTASESSTMSILYTVESGNPTVTVTNMLCCTLDEYLANKTLLDSIKYFDGDTMPRA